MRGGKGWEALFSFGLAQGVAFVATLVRIPFAIESVGAAGLGVLALAVALGPWLCLMAVSTRSAIRILEGEGGLGGKAGKDVLAAAAALTGRFGLYVAALGVILLLGVSVGPETLHRSDLAVAVGIALVCTVGQGRGSVRLGLLDAAARFTLVNSTALLISIASLALAIVASVFDLPFWVLALAFVAPAYGAAWIASLLPTAYVQRERVPARPEPTTVGHARRLVKKLTRMTFVQQVQNGLDPFVIGWALGPTAVAQYSVASRITVALITPIVALQPLIVRWFARGRVETVGSELRSRQLRLSSALAGGTLVIGAVIFAVSEPVLDLIGGGEVEVPTLLTLAVIGQATAFAWQAPVIAALGGVAGTRVLERWFVLVAGVNVVLSVLLVRYGVWVPTAVSVGCAAVGHVGLSLYLRRRQDIYEGVH